MGAITIKEIRQCGLTVAEFARRSAVPYQRVWGAVSGGGVGLKPDEVERLQRALEEARSQPA